MKSAKSYRYEGPGSGRLDMFLLESFASDEDLSSLTRSQIKRLIEDGEVYLNGRPVKKSGTVLKAGAEIEVRSLPGVTAYLEPYRFDLNIVFEDKDLLVVDKPAGISMHPGAGEKHMTMLNAIVGHLDRDYLEQHARPGVVHRLDKDTTGLVVFARNTAAHGNLSRQFADREVVRSYQALCLCTPRANRIINKSDSGTISARLGRHPTQRVKMAVVKDGGREAVTNWEVLERMNYGCLLKLKLNTGRTHQIRVHLDYIGSPVIGDKTYGNFAALPGPLRLAAERFPRQALHACSLGFIHPATGRPMHFESPVPNDMKELIDEFRNG